MPSTYQWATWRVPEEEITAKLQECEDAGWEIVSVAASSYPDHYYLLVCRKK